MKENFAAVALIVDRSGSMWDCVEDTKGGMKSFLKGQKEAEGDTIVTLVYFDNVINTVVDMGSIEAAERAVETYSPRGSTSLLDAIGMTIQSMGEKLDAMDESEKPSTVTVAIITDGQENSSREYTKTKINEMITHQTKKYNWQFMFLSSDLNAVAEAQTYGISLDSVATYSADNTTKAFFNMSSNATRYRSTGIDMGFTQEEILSMNTN